MSATPPAISAHDAERLDDLLADRAVFGLDVAETTELDRLLTLAGRADDPGYDLAAAAVLPSVEEALPKLLRDRVLDDAADFESKPQATPALVETKPAAREWPVYTLLAVAAGVLLSIYLGELRPGSTPVADRLELIAEADDVVQVAWAPQEDASLSELDGERTALYGDVVWSDAKQSGYMRFRGLRPNDPTVEQYQLWVFDEARSAEHPVDGGVFDIAAAAASEDGEVIVPIDAKLPITKATLFAITVERPGGVVVSDRSRLPLLAQR